MGTPRAMEDSNASMNVGNKLGSRRSVRVNQAPGGASSICLGGGHFAEHPTGQREQCPFGVSRHEQQPADRGAARQGADARLHAAPFATGAASTRGVQLDSGFVPASGGKAPFATATDASTTAGIKGTGRRSPGGGGSTRGLLSWE